MVFDFAAQPPELISAKIYSGPGTESLQAAASAWDGLASELQSTAANFESVVSGLISGDWTGPSSEAAAAAATPYVSWLSTTAGQAEQTAGQARAAASAYETALAATVPPAGDRGESHSAAIAVAGQPLRAEQRGDRGRRSGVHPVLGSGCRRLDWLRRIVASGNQLASARSPRHRRRPTTAARPLRRPQPPRRPRRRRPMVWKRSSSRSRPMPPTSLTKSPR